MSSTKEKSIGVVSNLQAKKHSQYIPIFENFGLGWIDCALKEANQKCPLQFHVFFCHKNVKSIKSMAVHFSCLFSYCRAVYGILVEFAV